MESLWNITAFEEISGCLLFSGSLLVSTAQGPSRANRSDSKIIEKGNICFFIVARTRGRKRRAAVYINVMIYYSGWVWPGIR